MKSPRFILALQHASALDAWIKITAVCRERGVTTLSFLSVVLLSAIVSAPSRLAAQATRPNIVVIMTDDQRLDDLRVLTKTRRLIGDQGTTFRNFYCSFPLCAPSRATFLTGQYAHNHGVLGNQLPDGGYSKLNHNNTLAVWLQDAGYFTSHIGKYLNRYSRTTEFPPGWSHWQAIAGAPNRMYNYVINDNGRLKTYGESAEDYQTDVIADRAVDIITEALSSQPFFLSIATAAVHHQGEGGVQPPRNPEPAPRDMDAFLNEPLPKPPSFNESDVSDKPSFIRKLPLLNASDTQRITKVYQDELASLLAVDDLVERIVSKLSAEGILDNTVLIFTSDNGFFHGEHRLGIRPAKLLAYEEASQVPLLIRGPSFPQGVVRKQFVSNIDLAPTIVDLADASPGRAMDGRSLLPFAKNPRLATARNLLIEAQSDTLPGVQNASTPLRRNFFELEVAQAEKYEYKAVRNRSFLYVEHSTGDRELYDMRPGTANYDPYQL
ncbi:MAG: sulfatase, partial [Pseudomonadota bacterium]|nr:sulfatase [Pseudomonadota bacterium]